MGKSHVFLVKSINDFAVEDGMYNTPIPGVRCLKRSSVDKRSKRCWSSCIAIVAQGCKEVIVGSQTYRAEEGHFTITPIDLHVISRFATASKEKPFLGILIDFDAKVVRDVAARIKMEQTEIIQSNSGSLFTGKVNDKVMECAVRLGMLFAKEEDAPMLGPLIIQEMIYYFLKSPEGAGLLQYVRSGSKMNRISEVIHTLKLDYAEEVDVESLARLANMNRSDFFRYFKEATAMSPIQYQKRLRLFEAKRLMIEEGETAEGSAFKVGYKSSSQFSREYARMFGRSPVRDTENQMRGVNSY